MAKWRKILVLPYALRQAQDDERKFNALSKIVPVDFYLITSIGRTIAIVVGMGTLYIFVWQGVATWFCGGVLRAPG